MGISFAPCINKLAWGVFLKVLSCLEVISFNSNTATVRYPESCLVYANTLHELSNHFSWPG